jgi:hypothetical protein
MQTINGKLIYQENYDLHSFHNKLEVIAQETTKLEPFLEKCDKQQESNLLALKYLEQRLINLEAKPLTDINNKLDNLEQALTKKILIIIAALLFGFAAVMFIKNQNNGCQNKTQSHHLNLEKLT